MAADLVGRMLDRRRALGASGLTFGSVSMMAVMADADDWNTGRAPGLKVLWFGVVFTAAPPIFGRRVERCDGCGAGLALLTAST